MTVEPIQLTLYGKPDCGLCDEGGLLLYPPHSWEKLRSVLAPPVPPPLNDA